MQTQFTLVLFYFVIGTWLEHSLNEKLYNDITQSHCFEAIQESASSCKLQLQSFCKLPSESWSGVDWAAKMKTAKTANGFMVSHKKLVHLNENKKGYSIN